VSSVSPSAAESAAALASSTGWSALQGSDPCEIAVDGMRRVADGLGGDLQCRQVGGRVTAERSGSAVAGRCRRLEPRVVRDSGNPARTMLRSPHPAQGRDPARPVRAAKASHDGRNPGEGAGVVIDARRGRTGRRGFGKDLMTVPGQKRVDPRHRGQCEGRVLKGRVGAVGRGRGGGRSLYGPER
jgi:hypothetical protein